MQPKFTSRQLWREMQDITRAATRCHDQGFKQGYQFFTSEAAWYEFKFDQVLQQERDARTVQRCESCQERPATRETVGGLLCEQCRAKIETHAGNE